MSTTTIARPSVASLFVQMQTASGVAIGSATAFLVQREQRTYLITNWHVVSGRRSDNGALISTTGALPGQLLVVHNVAGQLGTWRPTIETLYDAAGSPKWREHPVHRNRVDVIALELRQLVDIAVHAHDPWAAGPDLAIGVAQSVDIVGFPFGLTGGGSLAIWVRGSIATEPAFDYNELPRFLVDSRTRPGQSGSPVLIYSGGGGMFAMANGSTAVMAGTIEKLLGVYSGRINDQSDLGFVWKPNVVRDIIDSGVAGTATLIQ
jgi:hypothetical protein